MNPNFSHRLLSIALLAACLVLPWSGPAMIPARAAGLEAEASSFDITPRELYFEAYEGQPATPLKFIDIGKVGAYPLDWYVVETIPWLHIGPMTELPQPDGDHEWFPRGEAPAQLKVWVSPGLLAPGKYTGEITIAVDIAQNSPQTLPVTLVVKQSSKQDHAIQLTATRDISGRIELNWTPVNNPNLLTYRIYRGLQDTADYWFVSNTQTLSFLDPSTTLRVHTYYCYYVSAANPNGTSFIADSNTICEQTGYPMPPQITLVP